MYGRKQISEINQAHDDPSRSVMVWDLPLRLFHWSMVCVVTIAFITGYLAPDSWQNIHVIAGYALGCLLAFRIVWGFFGSYYSRFNTFPLSIRAIGEHLLSILRMSPIAHIGHNPVGAWVIIILLTLLTLLVLTGLVVLGGEEDLGPLASIINFKVGDFTEDIHEALSGILLGVISIHLLGVFVEVKIFRHPVLKAMISGRKPVAKDGEEQGHSYILRGSVLFLMVVGMVVFAGMKLNALPSQGARNIVALPEYKTECGDCHVPYHPSLLMAGGWRSIMRTLPDHYGEDASLENDMRVLIENFLTTNDALNFDTKVSHKIGRIETASNRMTDTKYWKKKHRKIEDIAFRHPSVGSKVNCNGCHKDAATGRFNDSNIHVPDGERK